MVKEREEQLLHMNIDDSNKGHYKEIAKELLDTKPQSPKEVLFDLRPKINSGSCIHLLKFHLLKYYVVSR